MRLALIKHVSDGRGEFDAVKLEYDIGTYTTRLSNIAYEYYIGQEDVTDLITFESNNKIINFIFNKFFKKYIDTKKQNELIRFILKTSFEYAFKMIERELKKESIKIA